MSKRANITALYRLNENECLQVIVSLDASYPDSVAEAKAAALGAMREMLADVIRQTVIVDES